MTAFEVNINNNPGQNCYDSSIYFILRHIAIFSKQNNVRLFLIGNQSSRQKVISPNVISPETRVMSLPELVEETAFHLATMCILIKMTEKQVVL